MSGVFPSVISKIILGSVGTSLLLFMELMLFTTKMRITKLQKMSLSSNVKYLMVTYQLEARSRTGSHENLYSHLCLQEVLHEK